jgi:hypothetical protein
MQQILVNPELLTLFDDELLAQMLHSPDKEKETLQTIFTSVWKAPQEKIAEVVAGVVDRIKRGNL